MTKKKKVLLGWIVTICMIIQLAMPVLAYANSNVTKITSDGKIFELSVEPYDGENGYMVNAEDVAKVFGLDYKLDTENKAFILTDEKHGKIILMHNATEFISGDKTYPCANYFYFENTVPMVELGFFCNMFGASYEKQGDIVTVTKNKISNNVPKLAVDGVVSQLYMEPYMTELGLMTSVSDVAAAFGVNCVINEDNSCKLSDDKHGDIILTDHGESFTSKDGEFGCSPFYYVENDIPLIEVGRFCEMYNASYNYDEKTKTLEIFRDTPMCREQKLMEKLDSQKLMATSNTLSGTVRYSNGAPTDGLSVKIIIQQFSTRYSSYYGYQYTQGNRYTVGTVNLSFQQISKNYSFDVSPYVSSTYSQYCVLFEETDKKMSGYLNSSGQISSNNSSNYISTAMKFNTYGSNTADINIADKISIAGTVLIDEDFKAPNEGLPVNLIIQTRSESRTTLYGASNYSVGYNYTLGTVNVPAGKNTQDYSFIVSHYNVSSYYPYYSLFYSTEDKGFVEPHGYYSKSNQVIASNTSEIYYQPDAKEFSFSTNYYPKFLLPVQDNYVGLNKVSAPVFDNTEELLEKGEKITISTETQGADIYYTTDGSYPGTDDIKYTGPIAINYATHIRAIAVKSGLNNSNIAEYSYKVLYDSDMAIRVSNVTTNRGKTVSIPVRIINNQGIASIKLTIYYETSAMSLVGVDAGTVFKNSEMLLGNMNKYPYIVNFLCGTSQKNDDGAIMNLKFKVHDDCALSDYDVYIYSNEAYDINGNYLSFTEMNGKTTVTDSEIINSLGDVNGDGIVNVADAILVLRFDAGYQSFTDSVKNIADVNKDGAVNVADAILILRLDAGLISQFN